MTTAMAAGDAPRRRGRRSPTEIVQHSGLPTELGDLVLAVTGKTRLWKRERADLAQELVSHFAEGLAAGVTPATLRAGFGDPGHAARLITRAKKRNRPYWWRSLRSLSLAVMWGFLALLALYLVLLIRYHWGSPKLTRNYLAEFNAPSMMVPVAERAWPKYREAYMALASVQEGEFKALKYTWPDTTPGDPEWELYKTYLARHQPQIEMIRTAARRDRAGYIARASEANPNSPSTKDPMGLEPPPVDENLAVIGILLPNLGAYRTMARVLKGDLAVAVETRDSERLNADLHAMLGIARHAREDRTLIAQLVGIAVFELTFYKTAELLREHPEVFTDEQLRRLAHAFGSFRIRVDGGDVIDLSVEQAFFDDLVQRCYTDDGSGDGHFVGMKSFYAELGIPEPKAVGLIAPIGSAVIAGRRDTVQAYHELFGLHAEAFAQPLATRDLTPITKRLDQLRGSAFGMRFAFITQAMPSLTKCQFSADFAMQHRDALTAAIALELYKRDHGTYPETLAALVPAYLPSVPVDRWANAPVRYLPNGTPDSGGKPVLYSIGANKVDDGGAIATPWEPESGGQRTAWPARDGDIPNKDWVLWPQIAPKGERPATRPIDVTKQSGENGAMAFMPWLHIVGGVSR